MDNQSGVLPPLPPSDPASLAQNSYDKFYNRSSRSFWQNAQIEYCKTPMVNCKHYFELQKGNFTCKSCHFGIKWGNRLTLSDGKLSYQGKIIAFGQ